jgi:hypothetical protein
MGILLGSNAAEALREAESERRYGAAHDFFHATPLVSGMARSTLPASGAAPSVATDQGSVQFHIIGQKPTDSKYSEIMQENCDNLLAMGGLIHGYMTRTYPKINTQTLDIESWVNVLKHLPDLCIGTAVDKTYKNRIAGVKVSGQFLSMIASAIITDGASLLTDFTSYLNSVGDVTFSASQTKETYNVLTCTFQSYLVPDGVGGYYDYSSIVLRQIDFLENFLQLKTPCFSSEYIDINMSYKEITTLVQCRRIRKSGDDYSLFQELINAEATKQFKDATNFFNGSNASQADIKPVN